MRDERWRSESGNSRRSRSDGYTALASLWNFWKLRKRSRLKAPAKRGPRSRHKHLPMSALPLRLNRQPRRRNETAILRQADSLCLRCSIVANRILVELEIPVRLARGSRPSETSQRNRPAPQKANWIQLVCSNQAMLKRSSFTSPHTPERDQDANASNEKLATENPRCSTL